MGILIKDMEMPETCDECKFHCYHSDGEYVCVATPMLYPFNLANKKGGRKDWCPLVEVPAAQSEIVRCKDCKHYHTDVFGREIGIEGMYGNLIVAHTACDRWSEHMNSVDPDGFCFLAERRTDER